MANPKRLKMLETITASGKADSFAWYGLALEYLSLKRYEEALTAFRSLRKMDADYVPQYLICGTMLISVGRAAEGREWLECGVTKAREQGDNHALSELDEALHQVPPPPTIG